MRGYLGSYLHQIDEKGRLSLPAPFRQAASEPPFVLVHVFPDALTIYPVSAWGTVEERLRELLRLHPESRPYVLGVTANAVEVSLDKQGRILVPARLQDAVGLSGPTLVVGAIDRIELWNPDRFRASVEAPAADFHRYTHQIFA
ncbi:MAG: cell division/cell wall cluster transcriptional repressor MraZ [Gemmatimonadota bacterium]|nr:cell division/cell wall cluster transcriptional repressor MraZ [Gemmatimonadota bacterium]